MAWGCLCLAAACAPYVPCSSCGLRIKNALLWTLAMAVVLGLAIGVAYGKRQQGTQQWQHTYRGSSVGRPVHTTDNPSRPVSMLLFPHCSRWVAIAAACTSSKYTVCMLARLQRSTADRRWLQPSCSSRTSSNTQGRANVTCVNNGHSNSATLHSSHLWTSRV
jgi:hypothetical protein